MAERLAMVGLATNLPPLPADVRTMEAIYPIIHAIYEAPLSTSIRESEWTFPIIQTFHIVGVLIFFGAMVLVDLRIIGIVLREKPANDVAKAILPLAWIGFAITAASGLVLFAAQAEKIYTNAFLITKFVLIAIAGLNLIAFHALQGRSIAEWGSGDTAAPALARGSAAASLVLWIAVVIAGRFIAYF